MGLSEFPKVDLLSFLISESYEETSGHFSRPTEAQSDAVRASLARKREYLKVDPIMISL